MGSYKNAFTANPAKNLYIFILHNFKEKKNVQDKEK